MTIAFRGTGSNLHRGVLPRYWRALTKYVEEFGPVQNRSITSQMCGCGSDMIDLASRSGRLGCVGFGNAWGAGRSVFYKNCASWYSVSHSSESSRLGSFSDDGWEWPGKFQRLLPSSLSCKLL